MTATTLLYHRDPTLLAFDAVVASVDVDAAGHRVVVLHETAFYPEAGGQMADRGVLGGAVVKDVQVDDHGVVRHVVDAAFVGAVGASVHGVVEEARRRQHMAMHTAQHLLSHFLFVENARAETVSSRLGETVCTLDVDVSALSDATLAAAEDAVNAVVDADIAVTAFFPDEQTLAALPLRRRPKVSENIRVVVVGDLKRPIDASPCGGTHVTRTSQIGVVRVTGVEKYKGMTRVSFQAGPRARREAFARARIAEQLAQGFSTAPDDVLAQVEKLRAQVKAQNSEKQGLLERLGVVYGDAAAARAADGSVVVDVVSDADMGLLRALAQRFVAQKPTCAIVVATKEADGGGPVVVARGAGSVVDCGALLKTLVAAHGGKGGGKPDNAQGRLAVVDAAALRATAG
jgi:alanyl-tRNA synthetase